MLEILKVTKLFPSKKSDIENQKVLSKDQKGVLNFSIAIKPGDIYGLVGDNGAGKSTLIKAVFGEYKRDGGTVEIDKNSIYTGDNLQRISYFPDQSVFPKDLSLKEFCLMDSELAGMKPKVALEKFANLLASLDLGDNMNKKFRELSAGMQKKALLAVTLVTDPQYIFLDEPTANLDVQSRIEFINIIMKLAEKGIGILITSHIIDELQESINKLTIIENGVQVYNNAFDNKTQRVADIYKKVTTGKSVNAQDIVDYIYN
ncbi:ABC transporter ATP-binding protein [Spiroplasma clarkii]|uniref:ABC transporter ATP-binding protein n=1 Tax=Spiroplasma clarkii TaxID=2139 RepID=A0A1Y0KZC3_9MOLU|nr:ABC transporter ATP-binding protein [Spiroplasma clarkii]ARU91071.1 ABC transporter ATP-binding protein [Spiroplasma clarkii]ATX70507.1 ABC transporter ATP-binding protein [Spiroplasma clarkii]